MEEENMKSKDTLDILSECISNLDDSSGKSTLAKSNSSLNNYEQKNDDEVNEESNALNDQNKDCTIINIIQEKNPGDDDGKIQSNDDIEKKEVEYENMEEEKYNLLFGEVDKEEEGDNNQNDEEEKEELMEEEKNNDKESLKSNTPCFNGFINVCNKKINQCEKTQIFTNRDITSLIQKNKDEQFNSKNISKKNSKEISHPNEDINDYAYLSGLFNMENQELISNESLTKENDDIAPENMLLSIIDNINSNSIHDSSDRATNCENGDLPPYDFIQIKETKSKTTQGKG
jgi:hypothetical protein